MNKQNIIDKKRAIIGGATFIAALLLIYGLYIGFNVILKQDEFRINKKELSFTLPDWVSKEGKGQIRDLMLLQDGHSVFEKDLTRDIAGVYNKTPFFKRVVSVKRKFPNKINVALELRKPAAIVKSKSGDYLVDAEGVRLPDRYYTWPIPGERDVKILVDNMKDIPFSGKKWGDKRILAGVDLVKFLQLNNADKILEIAAIDVSNVGKRFITKKSDIILWTKNGTRIKWGCSKFCDEIDELSDAEKLRNLFSVAKQAGNKFVDMDYVDVRWIKPVGKSKGKI